MEEQEWFKKLAKVQKALENVYLNGLGEVVVTINNDNWVLLTELRKKEPNIKEIQEALDIAIEDGYGNLSVECREVVYLKKAKREKI